MKKAIALILVILIGLTCGAPLLTAAELPSSYPTLKENSVIYACKYNTDTKKVEIDGTVNHDVLVAHNNYEIEVYRLAPHQTFADVIADSNATPLATTAMAIKFHLSVEAIHVIEKFSKYAIVFRSSEGELLLAAEPQYVGVESDYQYSADDRSSVKGISSSQTSVAGSLRAGSAVIPVYWDRLLSTLASGYVYPIEDSYRYFDKAYIDELDTQIRTYSASGTRVYLQMLLPSSAAEMTATGGSIVGAPYSMPDIYNEEVLTQICACTEFLSQRYRDYQSGTVSGLILGTQIDKPSIHAHGMLSTASYVEQYAFYLLVVAKSARLYRSDMDIVVPFSNTDVYSDGSSEPSDDDHSPCELLEGILNALEQTVSVEVPFNVCIEGSESPLTRSTEEAEQPLLTANTASATLHAADLSPLTRYLQTLRNQFSAAPQHVIYLWTPPDDMRGSTLACNYLYSYYQLLQNSSVSSFVVSFYGNTAENTQLSELAKLIRLIDTAERRTVTQPLLPELEEAERQWLSAAIEQNGQNLHTVYRQENATVSEQGFLGSFTYVDFLSGNVSDWFCGNACKEIKSDYGIRDKRALHAVMKKTEREASAELLGLFEYPENYIYTPFLKLTLAVSDLSESANSLYEVVVTLGNDQAQLTSEYILHGNEEAELWLDLNEYNPDHLTNFIKISVRVLSGDAEEYSLWLYDITGYSRAHTSDTLAELISLERLKIREQTLNAEVNNVNQNLQWMVFAILTAVTVIGVGGYLLFQKHRAREEGQNKESEKTNAN